MKERLEKLKEGRILQEKCFKQQEHKMEKYLNLLAVLKAHLGDK